LNSYIFKFLDENSYIEIYNFFSITSIMIISHWGSDDGQSIGSFDF